MVAIEEQIVLFLENLLQSIGWAGIVVAMAIESACIPLPSEVTMPLSGWMLIQARGLSLWHTLWAGFYGAVGAVLSCSWAQPPPAFEHHSEGLEWACAPQQNGAPRGSDGDWCPQLPEKRDFNSNSHLDDSFFFAVEKSKVRWQLNARDSYTILYGQANVADGV